MSTKLDRERMWSVSNLLASGDAEERVRRMLRTGRGREWARRAIRYRLDPRAAAVRRLWELLTEAEITTGEGG